MTGELESQHDPHLIETEVARTLAEPAGFDCLGLLGEHSCEVA
jgi:hypothetical protein